MKRLIALLVFVALPAAAADWEMCESGVTRSSFSGGVKTLCVDLASGDLASAILPTSHADNCDAVYESDQSGAGTAISVQILSCVTPTPSTDTCKPIQGATLTGTASSFEIMGFAASWIYVQGSGTIGTETPRVLIKCN